jgi:hypothetical protein
MPDFDKTLARMEAWWDGQIIDRPPVSIPGVTPEAQPREIPAHHESLRDRWMDIEYQWDCFEAGYEVSVFPSDAFPRVNPDLGPDICATCYGAELEFGERTSWSQPVVENVRDILNLKLDLQNVYWRTISRWIDLSIERGRGRWLTGLPDLHTNGDLVAALRGPQHLCMDVLDDPEGVRLAVEHVTKGYTPIYEDHYRKLEAAGLPGTTWLSFLHAGRAYATNCDFICMISPESFQDAILPSIVEEMKYLERNIFHLDGPGALHHLDALLACEDLDAVQWVYGDGQGQASHWIEVYQKIQVAGKSMQVIAKGFEDARTVAEQLKPDGVWLTIDGPFTPEEANEVLTWAERWAAGKKA